MPSGDIPVLANLSVNSALENKNKRQKNATCCFYYFMLKVNLCIYAAYISYDIARTTRHAFLVGIVIDVNRIDDFYGMGANSIFLVFNDIEYSVESC